MMRRSKNLSDADVDKIAAILDGWVERLSWDALVDAISAHTGQSYTRQALSKHPRILAAFQTRKRTLADRQDTNAAAASSPELEAALQSIARLEATVARLEAERAHLLEQFARWAYNAHARGLGHDVLDRPLPPVDRAQTKLSKRS